MFGGRACVGYLLVRKSIRDNLRNNGNVIARP